MLLVVMFCTTFFVLPAIGMILLALKKIGKEKRQVERYYLLEEGEAAGGKKQKRQKKVILPDFMNQQIIDDQLIASQISESLHFNEVEPRAPCRAGP